MTEYENQDLSKEGTEAFLSEFSPNAVTIVKGMEASETWTRDKIKSVQEELQKFADRVADFDMNEIPTDLKHKLIISMGYISSGKAIKLLYWIDKQTPHFVSKTVIEAGMLGVLDEFNAGAAKLFVERMNALYRWHLLSRIFAPDRFKILKRALDLLNNKDSDDDEELDGDNINGYA